MPKCKYYANKRETCFTHFAEEAKGEIKILRFYMYSEMGVTPPTLYGTMMTKDQADKMWGSTQTKYWAVPGLGYYTVPIDPAQHDTTPPPAA